MCDSALKFDQRLSQSTSIHVVYCLICPALHRPDCPGAWPNLDDGPWIVRHATKGRPGRPEPSGSGGAVSNASRAGSRWVGAELSHWNAVCGSSSRNACPKSAKSRERVLARIISKDDTPHHKRLKLQTDSTSLQDDVTSGLHPPPDQATLTSP